MKKTAQLTDFLFPLSFYTEMFQAGLQAGQFLLSSAEVIGRRSNMLAAGIPGHHPEFARMWQEKITANLEAWVILSKNLCAPMQSSLPEMIQAQLKLMQALSKPYHSKVTANATRLRGKGF